MESPVQCPVCGANQTPTAIFGDSMQVDCQNCGRFTVSDSARGVLRSLVAGNDRRNATLIGYTLRGLQRTNDRPLLTADDAQRIVANDKLPSPITQADNLVRYLGAHSEVGKVVTVAPESHGAILGITTIQALHVILNGLKAEGSIQWNGAMGTKQHTQLTLTGWQRYEKLRANAASPSHRLSAVLSTDVAGYTALMAADEQSTLTAVAASMATVRRIVERFGGRVFKTTGDGALSEFPSAVSAMRAALDVQTDMALQNASKADSKRVTLRIGLAVGDVSPDDDEDVLGDTVNLAARLQAEATPGTICTLEHIRDDLANKLELSSKDLGLRELKGIGRRVRVVQITPQ